MYVLRNKKTKKLVVSVDVSIPDKPKVSYANDKYSVPKLFSDFQFEHRDELLWFFPNTLEFVKCEVVLDESGLYNVH